MSLAYLVVGVVLLTSGVIWAEDTDSDHIKAKKPLIALIVIVALACIVMSFTLALGVHL